MNISKFLTTSGAIVIGIIGVTAVTFPILAIFIVFGYFLIQENISKDED